MKFLAIEIEVPGVSVDAFTDELLADEVEALWRLNQAGTVREVYYRTDRKAKVLILECPDPAGARAAIDSLPLVQRKLIDFDIIGLGPYRGWMRLR